MDVVLLVMPTGANTRRWSTSAKERWYADASASPAATYMKLLYWNDCLKGRVGRPLIANLTSRSRVGLRSYHPCASSIFTPVRWLSRSLKLTWALVAESRSANQGRKRRGESSSVSTPES